MRERVYYIPLGAQSSPKTWDFNIFGKKKNLHFCPNRCHLHKCVVSDVIQKFSGNGPNQGSPPVGVEGGGTFLQIRVDSGSGSKVSSYS